MSETDRATLLHAAELLEACAAKLWALPDNTGLTLWDDAVATARALREMTGE